MGISVLYLSVLCSESDRKEKLDSTLYDAAPFQFNRQIVKGLIDNDCDVTCLSHVANYSKRTICKEEKITFVNFRRMRNYILNQLALFISVSKYTRSWCKQNPKGYIVVDVMDSFLASAVILNSKKHETVAIVTDSTYFYNHRTFIDKINEVFFNYSIHNAKGYVLLTKQMTQLYGEKKPYVVIEALYSAKEANHNPYQEKPFCIYAGAVDEQYGITKLIDAFCLLDDLNLELHIYGPCSGRNIITNLPQNVKYCGNTDRSRIIEKESEAMLLINPRPTEEEFTKYSFPSKTIEYMASGTVAISTKLPGIPSEYVPYLIWIEEESVNGIAETIRKAYNLKKEERCKMAREAREFVEKYKEAKLQTRKILDLIGQMQEDSNHDN